MPILAVIDLETTGLDPRTCSILEIGAIFLDADLLTEVGRYHVIIRPDTWAVLDQSSAYVIDMHSRNGLLAQCHDGVPESAAIAGLATAMLAIATEHEGSFLLTGNSPHGVDGPFLRAAFDRLAAPCVSYGSLFGHRMLDMTAVYTAFRIMGLPTPDNDNGGDHRAMSDALSCVDSLRSLAAAYAEIADVLRAKSPRPLDAPGRAIQTARLACGIDSREDATIFSKAQKTMSPGMAELAAIVNAPALPMAALAATLEGIGG